MSKSSFSSKLHELKCFEFEILFHVLSVHNDLEGAVKEKIKKSESNVILAYYVQTFLIVAKLFFLDLATSKIFTKLLKMLFSNVFQLPKFIKQHIFLHFGELFFIKY